MIEFIRSAWALHPVATFFGVWMTLSVAAITGFCFIGLVQIAWSRMRYGPDWQVRIYGQSH